VYHLTRDLPRKKFQKRGFLELGENSHIRHVPLFSDLEKWMQVRYWRLAQGNHISFWALVLQATAV
jgi:hypothetical protein